MSIRSALNSLGPKATLATAGVIAALVAMLLYYNLRQPATGEEQTVVLKCAGEKCGEVVRMRFREAVAKATKQPEEIGGPGVTCPKCKENTLASADVCPQGHVYVARIQVESEAGGPPRVLDAKCPTCGYDRAEEARAALRRQLGK